MRNTRCRYLGICEAESIYHLTADADFVRLTELHGTPPQVIRLERTDYSTEAAAELIRRYAIAIAEFEKSARAVLILKR